MQYFYKANESNEIIFSVIQAPARYFFIKSHSENLLNIYKSSSLLKAILRKLFTGGCFLDHFGNLAEDRITTLFVEGYAGIYFYCYFYDLLLSGSGQFTYKSSSSCKTQRCATEFQYRITQLNVVTWETVKFSNKFKKH